MGGVVYHYQGDSVSERLVRAQQFATWAYQVLGNDHTLNIKLSPGKESEDEKDSDKKLIYVNNGDGFRTREDIFNEAFRFING